MCPVFQTHWSIIPQLTVPGSPNPRKASEASIVIAEVTQPSIGVGYEIAAAEALEKTIVCLFRPDAGVRRSAMLASEGISHIEYTRMDNLKPKLAKLFEE